MARNEIEVDVVLANPLAFARVKEFGLSLYQPAYYTPSYANDGSKKVPMSYAGSTNSSSSHLASEVTAGRAGAILHWNSKAVSGNGTGANFQAGWKTIGGGIEGDTLNASVHVVPAGELVGLSDAAPWKLTHRFIGSPFVVHASTATFVGGVLKAEIGTVSNANHGSLAIDGVTFKLDSNQVWSAQLATQILELGLQLREGTDFKITDPAVEHTHSTQADQHSWKWDTLLTGSKEARLSIPAYHTEGGTVLKTTASVNLEVEAMNGWLLDRDRVVSDAMRQATTGGAPVSTLVGFPAMPASYAWLSASEQKRVDDFLISRREAITAFNSGATRVNRDNAVNSAYDEYLAGLGEGEVPLGKSAWLDSVLGADNDEGLGSWLSTIGSTIKGFGTGVAEFVTENPGIAGVGAIAAGAKLGGVPTWAVLAGAGAVLLLVLK